MLFFWHMMLKEDKKLSNIAITHLPVFFLLSTFPHYLHLQKQQKRYRSDDKLYHYTNK